MLLKKRLLLILLVMIFLINTVYGSTNSLPTYKVKAFLSGFMETIVYGSEDGYIDFCTGEAGLNETDRKELFKNRAEQNMKLAYVDMSETTVTPAKMNADKYGTRFLVSCYIVKAQHSPNGFDYYKVDLDLSVNILEAKKKITKIYSKKTTVITANLMPKDLKTLLDNRLKSQLPEDYFKLLDSKVGYAKGTLNDLVSKGILEKKRSTLTKNENGVYELAVGLETDEQYEFWEQYYEKEITFVKPSNNTKWKEYAKYKGFSAVIKTGDLPIEYTYYTVKGVKASGKIEVGTSTWELKNCDLTKPFAFSGPVVIKEITLK